MSDNYYAPGDWNAVCYVCGFKFKASELIRHWQGYYVCSRDWEPRQPQDFVRAQADAIVPPWTQPMPAPIFAAFCTPNGRTAMPGFAEPGCVMPNNVDYLFDDTVHN